MKMRKRRMGSISSSHSCPSIYHNRKLLFTRRIAVIVSLLALSKYYGFSQEMQNSILPQPVLERQFEELLERSPFIRSLDLSDTLVLTGVAEVDGKAVATLIDTENGRSIAISETPNLQGWKLTGIRRMDDLEVAVATVTVESGEVIQIRYDRERIKSTAERLKYKSQARSQMAAARARIQSRNGPAHGVPAERVEMLRKIDQAQLPEGYNPGAGRNNEESHKLHQDYVDKRMAGMSDRQRGQVGQLWKEKQATDPGMPNRGASFVRIMDHVAENEPR